MECSEKVKIEEGLLLSSTATSSEEGVTEVETKKCCSDCKTTKTPLWRSGPSGPKSLCNACGIRYRKKWPIPTAANDLKKGKIRGKRRNHDDDERDRRMRVKLKKRSGGRQWGEVERAALLLMALSCGAVFA